MERSIRTKLIAVLVSLMALATVFMGLSTGFASASQYLDEFNANLTALDGAFDGTDYDTTVLTDAAKAENVVKVFDNYKVMPASERTGLDADTVTKYEALKTVAFEAYEVRNFAVQLFDYYNNVDGKEVTYSMNDDVVAYRARYTAMSAEEKAFADIWNANNHLTITEGLIADVLLEIQETVTAIEGIYHNGAGDIVLNSITTLNTAKGKVDALNPLDYKYLYAGNDVANPLVAIPANKVGTDEDRKFVYDEAWADYNDLLAFLEDLSDDIEELYTALTDDQSADYEKYWTNKADIDALEVRYNDLDVSGDNNMKAKFDGDYADSLTHLTALTGEIDDIEIAITNVNDAIAAIGAVAYADVANNATSGELGVNDDTYHTPKAEYDAGTSFYRIAVARTAFLGLYADIIAHDDAEETEANLWVANYFDLLDAEAARNEMILAVLDVIDAIDDIEGAPDTQAAALTARTAYNALVADQKLDVTNYSTVPGLQYWEARVAQIVTSAQQVDLLIGAIPAISATDACRNAILAARDAYEAHVLFVEDYNTQGINVTGYTEESDYGVTLYALLVEAEEQYAITAADVIAWTDAVDAIETPVDYTNWDLVAAAEAVFAELDPLVYTVAFLDANYHDTYVAYNDAIAARDAIKAAADAVVTAMEGLETDLGAIAVGEPAYEGLVVAVTTDYEALGGGDAENQAAAEIYVQGFEEAYANYLAALNLVDVIIVEKAIVDAIGAGVTLDSDFTAAEAAYAALSDDNQALVRNYLADEDVAVDTYVEAVEAKAEIVAALEAWMDAVDALYDPANELPDGEHFTVATTDLSTLSTVDFTVIDDLKTDYTALVGAGTDAATRTAYLADSKALLDAIELRGDEIIADVVAMIDALPNLFEEVANDAQITAIGEAYEAYIVLSDAQKEAAALTDDTVDLDGDATPDISRTQKLTDLYNMVVALQYFKEAANTLYSELTKVDAVPTIEEYIALNVIKSFYGKEGLGAYVGAAVNEKVIALDAAWIALVDENDDGVISDEEFANILMPSKTVAILEAISGILEAYNGDFADIAGDIAEINATVAALDAALEALDEAYQAADNELAEAIEAAQEALQEQLDALVARAEALEAKDEDLDGQIEAIEAEIEALNAALEALDEAYAAANAELSNQITLLTEAYVAGDAALQDLIDAINAELDTVDGRITAAVNAAIATVTTAYEAADGILNDKITAANNAITAADTALNAKIDALNEKVDDNYVELNKKIVIVAVVLGVINAALVACVIVLFVKKRA